MQGIKCIFIKKKKKKKKKKKEKGHERWSQRDRQGG